MTDWQRSRRRQLCYSGAPSPYSRPTNWASQTVTAPVLTGRERTIRRTGFYSPLTNQVGEFYYAKRFCIRVCRPQNHGEEEPKHYKKPCRRNSKKPSAVLLHIANSLCCVTFLNLFRQVCYCETSTLNCHAIWLASRKLLVVQKPKRERKRTINWMHLDYHFSWFDYYFITSLTL